MSGQSVRLLTKIGELYFLWKEEMYQLSDMFYMVIDTDFLSYGHKYVLIVALQPLIQPI